MSNMSYCRHENTASDLDDVWDHWYDVEDSELNDYELRGRKRIRALVREMYEQLEADGDYDEASDD